MENKPSGAGWHSDRFRTTVLVNLTAIMERMDEQILPAVYAFIGVSFHATPSELGLLTLSRALVQALSSPIGGLAGAEQLAILDLLSSTLPGLQRSPSRLIAFAASNVRPKQLRAFCKSGCTRRASSMSWGLLR